ncbi:hypothetical protein [Priestia filamentosa]|uniref:hypothetical protein n=1 Tax=Priestia filamentosa TaxID=1402861 RepID=UPI002E1B07C3|nr:hypothetical protein [Priestia filamentosa]
MWAIERFGFPFAYDDSELENANKVIRDLINQNLISKNNDSSLKYINNKKQFILQGFDILDIDFLCYLCITRGISDQLGYIKRVEANYAYQKQGLICHWEHGIELMPYEKFEHRKRCPIFGHNCPGGIEQATYCKGLLSTTES